MKKNKAFSFVEIIITISIISLLAIISISSKQRYEENKNNSKIVSEISTINNAFISLITETQELPLPWWNLNFYSSDTSYCHSYEDPDTFWVYWTLTENVIPKKYLNVLPLDPVTNSYYSYWKTKDSNQFEVASVQHINTLPIAKVIWNYNAENGPLNLIREYNWPNFVFDWSNINFPYNPEELVLIARVKEWWEWVVYRQWDEIKTWAWEEKEIFFSDWSVSVLEENSQITLNKLNFKWEDNLNTLIKIALWAWTIWTRATKLSDQSSFEIYTKDTVASVRWTIFKVWSETNATDIEVIEWIVDVNKINISSDLEWVEWKEYIIDSNSNIIEKWSIIKTIEVKKWEDPKIIKIENNTLLLETSEKLINIDLPIFSKDWDDRDIEETNITKNSDDNDTNININVDIDNCQTFKISWNCVDWEANPMLTASWYNLIAYAPYDQNSYTERTNINKNYLKLYSSDNSIETTSNFQDSWRDYDFNNNIEYLIKDDWVFLDNINVQDYIIYDLSNLKLWDDFAIEMSVSKDTFNQDWWRYIFDNKNNKWLYISKNSWKYYLKYNGDFVCSDISDIYKPSIPKCSFYFYNNFEKIIIENWKSIKIWQKTFNIGSIQYIDELYIWSKYDKTLQLNWIIDYLKIYN